jgi:DIM1 family U5 snRNP protein
MSYFLPHLPSGWHVDEAIKSEEDRVVVIRFGHDWDSQCMVMDETLYSVAEKVQNFAVIYLCDITEVPDFNKVGGHPTQSHLLHANRGDAPP